MTRQLVSIIIPTYQHAQTIAACLDSVFAQTYAPIEIIVVNDGSTDNTLELLDKYRDSIKLIDQENQGSNNARNNGFNASTGEYVCFCDADVVMRPDMIEKLFDALHDHADAGYTYSAFKFGWKTFKGVPFNANKLRIRNFIHSTSLIRRKDFPGFDPAIKRLQDWDVWLTMLAKENGGVLVNEVLFEIQVSGESRIGSKWQPSFVYKLPWKLIGWRPKAIVDYERARDVIKRKHSLN
ncbi:MAG: glycosyltransferase family 2 protein [bacterium]